MHQPEDVCQDLGNSTVQVRWNLMAYVNCLIEAPGKGLVSNGYVVFQSPLPNPQG